MKMISPNRKTIKGVIFFSLIVFTVDLIYRSVNNISFLTREKCILYRMMPELGFLFFEYFVELLLTVVVGIYLASLLEAYFTKYKRFYPSNPFTAFVYASILPVCACATIPLLGALKNKVAFRTIVTFIVAAPLLSPYIVLLSFSVLGFKYGFYRIISSFILAVLAGFVMEVFYTRKETSNFFVHHPNNPKSCSEQQADIYIQTYLIFKKIFPYLVIAGIGGIVIEIIFPAKRLINSSFIININGLLGVLVTVIVATPIYLCNGAEILLLRPLIHQGGLELGTAMAFSLASTSICITSIVIMVRYLGKKLTFVLVSYLILGTLLLGLLLNTLSPEVLLVSKLKVLGLR